MPNDPPVVLVVEDEPDVAETYRLWLRDDHEVAVVESGDAALSTLADRDVDAVLLDRMMPGMSGDEVLAELRARDDEVGVAMVSAVDPDFDILELGLDDYVIKPPTREGLRETVADLVDRREQAADRRRYHRLVSKRAALDAEKTDEELADSEQYQQLAADIEALEGELDDEEYLDDAAFVASLREEGGEGE